MTIATIITILEKLAPPSLQESYDNCGLITGKKDWECTGIVCTLDATEAVLLEAKENGCNMVVAHHPIVFTGLKKMNGDNYVEQTIITAIKNDIAIYAIHTNLDNVLHGVNNKIANSLNLLNRKILAPKNNLLSKLFTFVPVADIEKVRQAIFNAGAGHIGNYSECSFTSSGIGTFKALENANPYVGNIGTRHEEDEVKLEVILPNWLQTKVVNALKDAHPYEEVAYEIVPISNELSIIGSGLIGVLAEPINATDFLHLLKKAFGLQVIKHTQLLNKPIQKVAICGGAGSFLINQARKASADIFITADMKYHEFFDANNELIIADIGHWESEQFTTELLAEHLQQNFPTFAVLKSKVKTNPVEYFL